MQAERHLMDQQHVSRIGVGLISLYQVPELQQLLNITSLCLHANGITRIEGLERVGATLTDLNLSSNSLIGMEGLAGLSCLRSLNLASNKLPDVHGLEGLSSLSSLNLSYNQINSLSGVSSLQGPLCSLSILSIKQNQLRKLQDFAVLVGCVKLREVHVEGNPVCQVPNYRQALATVLPQITQLDSLNSTQALAEPYDMQAARQHATATLHAFEQQQRTANPVSDSITTSMNRHLHHHAPHSGDTNRDLQAHQHSYSHTDAQQQQQHHHQHQQQQQQQQRPTPQVDIILAGFHRRWQQQQPPTSQQQQQQQQQNSLPSHGQESPSQPLHTFSPSPQQQPPPTATSGFGTGQTQPVRQPANWQTAGRRQQRTNESVVDRTEPGHTTISISSPSKRDIKSIHGVHTLPSSMDAAVQTLETAAALKSLQTEATELQQQLCKLTDELSRRNNLEDESTQAMEAALSSADLRVEDAYKDASHAVERALQEVEAARRQAADSSERAVLHSKYEEEYKIRCVSLEKDIHRLREDLQKCQTQSDGQAQSAASTLADHRHISQLADQAAQQQLSSTCAELMTCRAAAAVVDQKILVLEAALQQSSAVTLSLTTQIAQAMSEASTQGDHLKGRIVVLDHQTSEMQRRETDSRAEINILTAAMAAAQHQYQQELKDAHTKHQETLAAAIVRERGVAEERGKGSILLAAQQERSVMQEQVTFLKLQMQYALKESEGELCAAHDQIQQAVCEASELRAALVTANTRHQEHEALVEEFVSVVTQQKGHMQALQQDLQAHQKRLSECTPERLDLLLSENAVLKRSCDELHVLKEQVEHYRGLWLGSNKKNAELEIGSNHAFEEIKARCIGLESSLGAAKEEARHCVKHAEKQAAQLVSAQDGFKIKTAMLDSANETVSALKGEVADLNAEIDEARRCAEESDIQFRRMHDQGEQERAGLRSEIEAGESALEGMESGVSDAQTKCKEAESRLKLTEEALAEKDGMIKYVEEEVERVKGMFEKREGRLREERDAARMACDAAASEAAECNLLLARLPELSLRGDALASELESTQAESAAAHAASKAASTAATIAGAEAVRMGLRLAEVESEMQGLLEALERQKAVSASKMQQLTMLLQDL